MLISTLHIGVGTTVVTISSFLNAELRLLNWETSTISIYLGIPVLFEIVRLPFGHFYDNHGTLRKSLLLGLVTSALGLLLLPSFLTPAGNFTMIFLVALFYFGSSILTTLVDANLTVNSGENDRSRIAGIIQVFRLLGFAIGGIVGSILYRTLVFTSFIQTILVFYVILGGISLIFVYPSHGGLDKPQNLISNLRSLPNLIRMQTPLLMTIFLVIYPIGLFMQDLILEPFAIDLLDFKKDNVGQVVALWTSLTLIFVPIGAILASRINRIFPFIFGEVLSAIGLLGLAVTSLSPSIEVFYVSVILFGVGNGIASAPAIGMMLDVASAYPKHLAMLLGFFGILNTVGRFLAAVLGGLILIITENRYVVLFLVEAVVVVIGMVPLIRLSELHSELETNPKELNPIKFASLDLS